MRKYFFVAILNIFLFSNINASDNFKILSEQQIKTLVCQKWKLTYLEYKGKKKEIPAKVPSSHILFLPDGKLEEFEGDKKYTGTWSYNHTTNTLTTIDKDGEEKHTIVEIDNNVLVMNGKYKGFSFNMGFKKVI